jgi:hypothetical protein
MLANNSFTRLQLTITDHRDHVRMTDHNPSHTDGSDERTTNDVRREAEEAMRLYSAFQHHQEADGRSRSGVFHIGMLLRVEVQGADTPIHIIPKPEMVIGRTDPASGDQPELDLSPYAAYQMGISRRHAVIQWQNEQLHIVDLGSRNGTYVNGKKVQPHQPFKLRDGDEMRLGKMSLKLYFRVKSE